MALVAGPRPLLLGAGIVSGLVVLHSGGNGLAPSTAATFGSLRRATKPWPGSSKICHRSQRRQSSSAWAGP